MEDNKTIYKYGLKMKADSDDKYMVVYCDGDTATATTKVERISSQALRNAYSDDAIANKDGNMVHYVGTLDSKYYLVNTSGTIIKNKTAAKDGDDWYFYVDNKKIKMYTSEKDLNDGTKTDTILDDLNDDWDDADIDITNSKGNLTTAPSSSLIKK